MSIESTEVTKEVEVTMEVRVWMVQDQNGRELTVNWVRSDRDGDLQIEVHVPEVEW